MIQESNKNKIDETAPTVNNNDIGTSNHNETETNVNNDTIVASNQNKTNTSVIKETVKKTSPNKNEKRKKLPKSKPVLHKPKPKVQLSNGSLLPLPGFQCNYCNKTFSNKASIRRHIYVHLNAKPYECVDCLKRFTHEVNLQYHLKKRHPELYSPRNFKCQICEKVFRFKETLSIHLDLHVNKYGSFKCLYCEESFNNISELAKHKKTNHFSAIPLDCHICSERFSTHNKLVKHLKEHLKLNGFICQYCGKEYKELNSMRRHVQVSHAGRRIVCPVCNKKLKGHLSEHMRVHEKERPHECTICGQRFTQSTQLNVHRRSHTGDRPYECRICSHRFSHSNALMLHIRRHTGEKPFPCAMCPLTFSQLPHMKAHMRNIHGKDSAYKCAKCGQFFKLKANLGIHSKVCNVGSKEPPLGKKTESSGNNEEVDSSMSLSRMRFLLALLLTMIASEDKLKYLGFNKRLIDDLLIESLEAMGQTPTKDESLPPLRRLKVNIDLLLKRTVPKQEMAKFRSDNKTTEEILELLTDNKKMLNRCV
ncbi:zinc finger protein 470 isoform X2 [Amyelois transitella]|nr:zinc finger protein 470 isoform X2 [Amyelois transitella]